jgi:hypothetical protein
MPRKAITRVLIFVSIALIVWAMRSMDVIAFLKRLHGQ